MEKQLAQENNYAWQDNVYYMKDCGVVKGNVKIEDGTWSAYVDDQFVWKYISKETAMAGVERKVELEKKLFDIQCTTHIREIKDNEFEQTKRWWFWK